MGKTLQHPRIFVEGNDPSGCVWGVLHVLICQNWRQIKKRLPHRKGGTAANKHASDADSVEDDTNALSIDDLRELCDDGSEDLIVDEKSTQCSTPSKGSIASRLKALISDEISKLKGRHHRSANQSQLTRKDSIHHLDPLYDDIIAIAKLHEEHLMASIDGRTCSTSSLKDAIQFPFINQKSEESPTDSPLKHKQFERREKQVSNNDVQNLEHHFEKMSDALDMVSTKKDSTMETSLDQHFLNEQAIENKSRYSKTISFPSTESFYKTGSSPWKLKHQENGYLSYTTENICHKKQKLDGCKEYFRSNSTPTIAAKYRADGILKLNQTMASMNQLRKNTHNQVVVKRFKDLRHKIKHAIKERKNEKHRITMDAILHKIPHHHGFSKDLQKEVFDPIKDFRESPRSSYESDPSLPSTIKSEQCITSRTSSFNESLDRYCQLCECSFNKQGKYINAEPSRLRSEHQNSTRMGAAKSMTRIFSLPNIKYTEASVDSFVENHYNTPVDGKQEYESNIKVNLNFSNLRDLDKEDILNDEEGQQRKLESISTVELDASDVEFGANASNMRTHEMEFQSKPLVDTNSTSEVEVGTIYVLDNCEAQEIKTRRSPLSELKEEDLEPRKTHLHPTKLEVSCEKLEDCSMDASNMIKTNYKDDKSDFSCKSLHENTLRLHVKDKDIAEFAYVRNILDISGFIKNKPLGIWHSEDQPLDCSMLEEVKHCMFFDPKCSTSEEIATCYQMLLFDLITEVLMEIYAKSYAYYPKPLTPLSQIRPMPIGHYVLEEVWDAIDWCLNFSHETDHHRSLDYVVSRDLAKSDAWMNIQNEVECVGLELEDLIFDHLLGEIIC